jgi:hypothetical protein
VTAFDWKAAFLKRTRNRKGPARRGSKVTGACPHCGSWAYEFSGRFKHCHDCGLDQQEEQRFTAVRFLMLRGRADEVSERSQKQAIAYYRKVYGTRADL